MLNLPKFEILEYLGEYWSIFSFVFSKTWWVLILVFIWIVYYIWLVNKRWQVLNSIEYILLAVTVPEDNENSPKAMEQIFAGLHAIKSGPSFKDKYFKGKTQEVFSFEIVSIAGNIRFVIRTANHFRDFVEANVYAHYPDAEIMEVDDYVDYVPRKYPNDTYDIFVAEIGLEKPDAYPIRTYMSFANELDKGFYDPISNLMEVMSRMGDGEQMWMQFVLKPTGSDWKKEGERLVKKLIGKKDKAKTPYLVQGLHTAHDVIKPAHLGGESSSKDEPPSMMQHLSPGEQEVVKAVESNISKIGYEVKMRVAYVGKKEVFDKRKGVNPLFGALKLYGTQNLNNLKPNTKHWTLRPYFEDQRTPRWKKKLLWRYKTRELGGSKPCVFSIEELATVYHYPYIGVVAPTLIRSEARKGLAPTDLPIEY